MTTALGKSDCHLTSRLLGYPPDARLLIINADDFGMCHAVNKATIETLQEGIVQSTTLMVSCPWALHAMHFLADHPEISFGVHLTAISDWVDYRWGPVIPKEKVPSLINKDGYFYNFDQMPGFLAQVNLNELEMEFRAQIEVVLAAGLPPTHLDWHSLRLNGGDAISELMFELAQEYGLAFRVRGQSWIEEVQRRGLPTNDYDFLDSYQLDPATKTDRYVQLLRELPVGLSEWAVHPGLANAELLAIDPGSAHIRQTDFNFLTSHQAKDIVKEEDIILLDYRTLQEVWRKT
ncbi:MAG: polysaccharide deacetylase family protein [Ardenticatenaceae bacterium]|nr:polysaccharide deacetylase family protein [Ardenticatenaceae bacterium]